MSDLIPPERKKRGRKPGCEKIPGSGRKPGTGNKISHDLKEVILARGKPLELLCDISRGVRVRVGPQAGPSEPQYTYPTLQERASAAKILLDKLMPTASSTEITGKDGAPLMPDAEPMTDFEVARRIAYVLAKGAKDAEADNPPPPKPAPAPPCAETVSTPDYAQTHPSDHQDQDELALTIHRRKIDRACAISERSIVVPINRRPHGR
jgi:hypothetical protein